MYFISDGRYSFTRLLASSCTILEKRRKEEKHLRKRIYNQDRTKDYILFIIDSQDLRTTVNRRLNYYIINKFRCRLDFVIYFATPKLYCLDRIRNSQFLIFVTQSNICIDKTLSYSYPD